MWFVVVASSDSLVRFSVLGSLVADAELPALRRSVWT